MCEQGALLHEAPPLVDATLQTLLRRGVHVVSSSPEEGRTRLPQDRGCEGVVGLHEGRCVKEHGKDDGRAVVGEETRWHGMELRVEVLFRLGTRRKGTGWPQIHVRHDEVGGVDVGDAEITHFVHREMTWSISWRWFRVHYDGHSTRKGLVGKEPPNRRLLMRVAEQHEGEPSRP